MNAGGYFVGRCRLASYRIAALHELLLSKFGRAARPDPLHLHRTRFELADEMGLQLRAFGEVIDAAGV